MATPAVIYSKIEIRPYAPNLGAEVRGITLAHGVSAQEFDEIRKAFFAHQVLFFRDQEEIPPLGTMLQLHILPRSGGDTMFSDMYAAWEALSAPMQNMLMGLTATHESAHVYLGRYADRGQDDNDISCPSAVHPVVRTHPDTKRQALYINRTFTTRINELSGEEGRVILNMLFDHCEQIEFQIRFRWSHNDMAFWDNRCCMHRAIWDYWPEERKGRRVTIKGDRPS